MVNEGREYRILGTIGKGGFGTVYKAELLGEGGFVKTVALKVLNAEVAQMDEVAQRLRDEARVLGLVHHRAMVKVDGLVKLDGRWTIVMEYVEGVDFKKLIGDDIPQGPALEMITEIASALRSAYEQLGPDGKPLCMLHRDIKPSNLALTAAGEVKVLDFGTARGNFASREARTEQLAFGTVDYMSPERMEFIDLPAGDIYALGVVLYEMLAGQSLGRTSPRPDKHALKRQEAVDALVAKGCNEGVVALVRDMLAFEAADRPTAREVEQRGRDLRAGAGGPWLSDWASGVVLRLLEASKGPKIDEMTGIVLREQSGSFDRTAAPVQPADGPRTQWVRTPTPLDVRNGEGATPSVPMPPPASSPPQAAAVAPPARSSGAMVAFVGVGATLFTLFAVAALIGLGVYTRESWLPTDVQERLAKVSEERSPEVVHPEAPAAEVKPAEVKPAEVVSGEATPPEAKPPEVTAKPVEKPGEAPATVKPAATKPKPAGTARVVVEGEATAVRLIKDGKAAPLDRVPPGTWTIEATFPGRGAVAAGSVTLNAGERVTVVCRAAFARCEAKR